MKDILKTTGAVLGMIGVFLLPVLFVVLCIPLYVFFGWIMGHIINLFCGEFVTNGLNGLLGTDRFTRDMLPMIGGALGFIGAFFKSSSKSGSWRLTID
jgi:hypothetical protein